MCIIWTGLMSLWQQNTIIILLFYRSLKLLRVFQRLLSAVAYWAPVVTESTFLPTLAFPFAKLLQNNQLIAFEVVATILVNWTQKWFDFIPNPPLNILSLIENVFSYHDKELFQVTQVLLTENFMYQNTS